MDKVAGWITAFALAIIAGSLGVTAYQNSRATYAPPLNAVYHAVILTGGQAYFGKIEDLRAEHLVLNDVFYIQSRQNPETKQVASVLVKRGQEWHAPDRMIVNRRHVLLIEPVTDGSQVARLIQEQGGRTSMDAKDTKDTKEAKK